jgi:hypothetical protein
MISDKTLSRVNEINFDAILNSEVVGNFIKFLAMNAMAIDGDKIGPACIVYYNDLTKETLNKDTNMTSVLFAITEEKTDVSTKLLKCLVATYQLTKWEKENGS